MAVYMPAVRVAGVVRMLDLAVNLHLHMRAADAAADSRLALNRDAGQRKAVHGGPKRVRVRADLQKRRGEHIPCSAHAAVQI